MSTEGSDLSIRPAAADWQEWQRQCAARRCSATTCANLHRFGQARFYTYCRRYAGGIDDAQNRSGTYSCSLQQGDAWHLLEVHCHVGRNRAGKSYKQWLFARAVDAPSWTAAIEAGVTLLLRDVVRAHLRREHSARLMTSLDAAHSSGQENPAWSLAELLPDPVPPLSGLEKREMRELAAKLAQQYVAQMSALERAVLVAGVFGIPFVHPGLQNCCQRKKSTLASTYQRVLKELAAHVRDWYPEECMSHCVDALRAVIKKLAEMILLEKMLDQDTADFFMSQGIIVIPDKDESA